MPFEQKYWVLNRNTELWAKILSSERKYVTLNAMLYMKLKLLSRSIWCRNLTALAKRKIHKNCDSTGLWFMAECQLFLYFFKISIFLPKCSEVQVLMHYISTQYGNVFLGHDSMTYHLPEHADSERCLWWIGITSKDGKLWFFHNRILHHGIAGCVAKKLFFAVFLSYPALSLLWWSVGSILRWNRYSL